MIKTDLYDGIWKEINEKGADYTNDFENFLLHRLNIKRMNYEYLDPKKKDVLEKILYLKKRYEGYVYDEYEDGNEDFLEDIATINIIFDLAKKYYKED